MSEISDARARLHQRLIIYTADVLEPERVHLYTPTVLATPCIWIAQPGVGTDTVGANNAVVRIVRFAVWAVPDGYDPVQCALLDELVARIWDAAYDLERCDADRSIPQPVDIGGPSIRGVVTSVDMTVFARTFCTRPAPPPVPLLEEAVHG